jgi:hypothetical protein
LLQGVVPRREGSSVVPRNTITPVGCLEDSRPVRVGCQDKRTFCLDSWTSVKDTLGPSPYSAARRCSTTLLPAIRAATIAPLIALKQE